MWWFESGKKKIFPKNARQKKYTKKKRDKIEGIKNNKYMKNVYIY